MTHIGALDRREKPGGLCLRLAQIPRPVASSPTTLCSEISYLPNDATPVFANHPFLFLRRRPTAPSFHGVLQKLVWRTLLGRTM